MGFAVGVLDPDQVLDPGPDHLQFFVELEVARRRTPLHQPKTRIPLLRPLVEIEVVTLLTTTGVLQKVLKVRDREL